MYLKIRTKNHSATPLRRQIQVTTPTVLRLGSTTSNEEIFPYEIQNNQSFIEINTPEACRISSNKILMKQKFIEHEIKTAEYAILSQADDWDKFPAIIKHKFSSKGNGIHYVPNKEAFDAIRQQLGDCENYIIEKYYTYFLENIDFMLIKMVISILVENYCVMMQKKDGIDMITTVCGY